MFFCSKYAVEWYFYFLIILQIVLESFPVSSSGHVQLLYVVNQKFQMIDPIAFAQYFMIEDLLYIPSLVAIGCVFYKQLFLLIKKSFASVDNFFTIVRFIVLVECITCLFYVTVHYFHISIPLWLGFLITSVSLYCAARVDLHSAKKVDYASRDGLLLGLFQGLAILPGISRFGFTYSCMVYQGYARRDAFFLSFLVHIPLIGILFLRGLYTLYREDCLANGITMKSAVIFLLATALACLGLIIMKKIIDKNYIIPVSLYVLIPALLSFLLGA